METIRSVRKMCVCCMEEHEVAVAFVNERTTFKGEQVEYRAVYEYCDRADELVAHEDMIAKNYASMMNAYRKRLVSHNTKK